MDFIDFDEPNLSFGAALKQNVINIYNIISFNQIYYYFIEQNEFHKTKHI